MSIKVVKEENKVPRFRPIRQYTKDGELVADHESTAAASRLFADNYKQQRHIAHTIMEACTGKLESYKSFIWKYKEEDSQIV